MSEGEDPGNPPLIQIRYDAPHPGMDPIKRILGDKVRQINAPGYPTFVAVFVTEEPTHEELFDLDRLMSGAGYKRTKYERMPKPEPLPEPAEGPRVQPG